MPRPVDTERRADLLDALVDEVAATGIGSRSLRELAEAVGTSHRMLIHHFGSRDELMVAVVDRMEERQKQALTELPTDPADAVEAQWKMLRQPEVRPVIRLFFECYARGAQGEAPFDRMHPASVDGWLDEVRQVAGDDVDPAMAPSRPGGRPRPPARSRRHRRPGGRRRRGRRLDHPPPPWFCAEFRALSVRNSAQNEGGVCGGAGGGRSGGADGGEAADGGAATGFADLVLVEAVGAVAEAEAGGRVGPGELAAGAVVTERPGDTVRPMPRQWLRPSSPACTRPRVRLAGTPVITSAGCCAPDR